jgi:hypothetical protein
VSIDGARHNIENLLYAYAAAADQLDVDRIAELLAHAEVDFAGQHATGREAVHALYKNAFREAPAVRHLISNVALDIRPGDVVGADLTASTRSAEPAERSANGLPRYSPHTPIRRKMSMSERTSQPLPCGHAYG